MYEYNAEAGGDILLMNVVLRYHFQIFVPTLATVCTASLT